MSCFALRRPDGALAGLAALVAMAAAAAGGGCSNSPAGTASLDDAPAAVTTTEAPTRLTVEIGPTVDPATTSAADSAGLFWPNDDGHPVRLSGPPVLTGRDVVSTRWSSSNEGRPVLVLSLSGGAAARFLDATSPDHEIRAVVRWDGEALYAPVVHGPISTMAIIAERSPLETIAAWLEERRTSS